MTHDAAKPSLTGLWAIDRWDCAWDQIGAYLALSEPDGRKLGGKEAFSRLWLADHEPWEAGAQPNTWMLRGLPFAELECLVMEARNGNFSCLQAEARGSLQVLLAIRDANPSSQLRSWWQGANYTAWRGVKAQDGEVVELCVLPGTPSPVYFMP